MGGPAMLQHLLALFIEGLPMLAACAAYPRLKQRGNSYFLALFFSAIVLLSPAFTTWQWNYGWRGHGGMTLLAGGVAALICNFWPPVRGQGRAAIVFRAGIVLNFLLVGVLFALKMIFSHID